MNSDIIIPIFQGKLSTETVSLVDARVLHQFLNVGKRFASWINERIEEYGFSENEDYITYKGWKLISQNGEIKKQRGGNRKSIEYHITLDMGKQLAMVEKNNIGQKVRKYFIEMEKKARGEINDSKLYSSSTKNDRVPLFNAIKTLALAKKTREDKIWELVNVRMGINHPEELTVEGTEIALAYVSKLLEGEYLPREASSNYPIEKLNLVGGGDFATFENTFGDERWVDPIWDNIQQQKLQGINVEALELAWRLTRQLIKGAYIDDSMALEDILKYKKRRSIKLN